MKYLTMILVCVGQLVMLTLASAMLEKTECVLKEGECTYHVYLDNVCGPADTAGHDSVQNDKIQRINLIQKKKLDAKSDHARRIEALENKILSMEKNPSERTPVKPKKFAASSEAVKTTIKTPLTSTNSPRFLSVPKTSQSGSRVHTPLAKQNEKDLLDTLHGQFTNLRTRLRSLRNQLRLKDSRLSETSVKLNQSQGEMLGISKKLLETEGKLFAVEIENADLKSSVGNREQELNKTQGQLDETRRQLRKAELEGSATRSNLAKTRKDLAAQKRNLKTARQELQRALSRYHHLNQEHEKTDQILKRAQQELVECYRGKTSHFCGFEDDSICGFMQDNATDYFNWSRGRGDTPSSRTGPHHDHTCGNSNGYYMYIEASGRGSNQNARLISPKYRSFTKQCIEFYYHMYGAHIGTLNVHTKMPQQEAAHVWRAFGDQGQLWSRARLPVSQEEAAKSYQVVFEAILEPGYAGDIAIDDFRVFDGECYKVKTGEEFAKEGEVTSH